MSRFRVQVYFHYLWLLQSQECLCFHEIQDRQLIPHHIHLNIYIIDQSIKKRRVADPFHFDMDPDPYKNYFFSIKNIFF